MAEQDEFDEWISVFAAEQLAHAREVALVLEARALPGRLERHGRQWMVFVPTALLDASRTEVSAWMRENSQPAGGERPLEESGRGWPGVVVWVVVLVAAAVLATRQQFGLDWYARGSADAGAIVNGEYWRTVTALMLHGDVVHLLGNLLFGSFFGYFAGRYLGDGLGWFVILLGGVIGNWLNALAQSALHRSVGASTAVFAALALLAAWRWRRGFAPNTSWRVRFAPLYAGVALLAFTGTAGESTDLGAHLFGFVVGGVLGLVATAVAQHVGPRLQQALACVCVLVCLSGWWMALRA